MLAPSCPEAVSGMTQRKQLMTTLSIYFPQKTQKERPTERLDKLAEKRDRSVNYLVVEAILGYLGREGKK